MPVEIKELVIRMVARPPASRTAANSNSTSTAPIEQEAVVAACVKEVLKILEKKQKR